MSWLESLIGATQEAAGRKPASKPSPDKRNQQIAEQQAVLNRLRSGEALTGAQPANPLIGGIQTLFGGPGAGAIPPLRAAIWNNQGVGEQVLINEGGWDQRVAGSGPINVGGRTWYPAQRGKDLIYKASSEAGKYGSLFPSTPPGDALTPGDALPPGDAPTPANPLSRLSPEDRAYQQERTRVEAMVKSNPDMQKQEIAEARAKVRDEGMAIWAAKHGGLAKQVKPGQSGYEAVQKTLYPGGTPVPTMSSESEAMLNAIAPANQQGVRANVTPMPGQLPSFGSATEGMFNAITGGGSLVTPMSEELIEKYKEQLLKQATK